MKKTYAVMMLALASILTLSTGAAALTVNPEVGVVRYADANNNLHWQSTTYFYGAHDGDGQTTVCDLVYNRVHTIQMRINTGTAFPDYDDCRYWDLDSGGPWEVTHAESIWPRGCRRFTDAGLAKTWWSETEELMGDDSLFWDYSDGDLFMAYGQTNSGVTRYEVYKVAYCLH